MYVQWNRDTDGAELSVIVSVIQSLKWVQEWYLGWEKVPCLERCPQFRSVRIEREVPLYLYMKQLKVNYCVCVITEANPERFNNRIKNKFFYTKVCTTFDMQVSSCISSLYNSVMSC